MCKECINIKQNSKVCTLLVHIHLRKTLYLSSLVLQDSEISAPGVSRLRGKKSDEGQRLQHRVGYLKGHLQELSDRKWSTDMKYLASGNRVNTATGEGQCTGTHAHLQRPLYEAGRTKAHYPNNVKSSVVGHSLLNLIYLIRFRTCRRNSSPRCLTRITIGK